MDDWSGEMLGFIGQQVGSESSGQAESSGVNLAVQFVEAQELHLV